MIGINTNDKSYAIGGLAKVFNTDGIPRTNLDPEEVRDAFAFDIEKRPSYDVTGRLIPGHHHLVRTDTNDIIPSAGIGTKFNPVQHMGVFDYIVNSIMPQVPEMELETVGTLHGGGTGMVMAKIGNPYYIPGDESGNTMRLMFSNPCNGYGSLIIGFTNVRLFCQNQIPVAVKQANKNGFSIRHTKGAELYIDKALEVIAASTIKAREIKIKSEGLAKINITESFIQKVMEEIYPFKPDVEPGTIGYTKTLNKREEVRRQFEEGETANSIQGDTAWKLFNAFTYPIYNPLTSKKSVDAAEIAYTGAIGNRADKVAKIFNTIYDMRYAA